MAEVTDVLVPYEILIRFGDDATPKGAHVQYRRVVTMDGAALKDEVQPATPLELDGFPTSEILTAATTAALAEINRLNAALASAAARIAELISERNALAEQLAGAT